MAHNQFQKHEQTPQELQNRSFDPTFDVAASEILGYDADGEVLRIIAVNSDGQLESLGINSLITAAFDYIALTYVAAGNGEGEVETAIYKTGGSGGTTVATLTLAYNASNEISNITKT